MTGWDDSSTLLLSVHDTPLTWGVIARSCDYDFAAARRWAVRSVIVGFFASWCHHTVKVLLASRHWIMLMLQMNLIHNIVAVLGTDCNLLHLLAGVIFHLNKVLWRLNEAKPSEVRQNKTYEIGCVTMQGEKTYMLIVSWCWSARLDDWITAFALGIHCELWRSAIGTCIIGRGQVMCCNRRWSVLRRRLLCLLLLYTIAGIA